MAREIDKYTAMVICGQIRRRRCKAVVFRNPTGFSVKALRNVSDAELGRRDVIGVYNPRVSFDRILTDWNDTL